MSQAAAQAYSTQVSEADVRLTPAAVDKMAELMAGAESDVVAIRVFVTGGGCGGMAYGMTYTDQITPYDSTLEAAEYKLVVDAVALNFLRGCEIDFAQDSFVFNNVFRAVGGSGMCGGCAGGGGY